MRNPTVVKNTPVSIQGDALYTWLDGADQYRWAGIRILREAMRTETVTRLAGRHTLGDGCTAQVTGDLLVEGDLLLEGRRARRGAPTRICSAASWPSWSLPACSPEARLLPPDLERPR